MNNEGNFADYFDFISQKNAAKGNKDLQKQMDLQWFLQSKGLRFTGDEYDQKVIAKYNLENEFERQLHNEIQNLFKCELPFYIKWTTRKRAAYKGCFTIPGNEIELCRANHFYPYGEHKGELSMDRVRSTLIHEYAHYVEKYISNWDNAEHGDIFEAIHFNLLRLAKINGYLFDSSCGKMDIDEDHFHNKMKASLFYIPVCKRMNLDPEIMLNDKNEIKTDYPYNFNIMIY